MDGKNIKLKPIEPDDKKEPFKDDRLNLKPFAELLTNIINEYSTGFCLALNGKWGTGKTTFIKMWRQYLENEGFKTLYFNAWENDYLDDPFLAILSQLKTITKNKEKFKKIIEVGGNIVLDVGKIALQSLIPVLKDYKEIVNAIIENIGDFMEKEIETYSKKQQGFKDFKERLKEFVKDSLKKQSDNYKPLVFFIDELDRCKPDYAVRTLEIVKHLFDVKNIIFVFGIDKIQLEKIIKGYYGSENFDANDYLLRFFDVQVNMPVKSFVDIIYEEFNFSEFFDDKLRNHQELQREKENFKKFAKILFGAMNLSIREQEKIMGNARLSLLKIKKDRYLFPSVFILLHFLRLRHPDIYDKIRNFDLTDFQDLVDLIEKPFLDKGIKELSFIHFIVQAEAILLLAFKSSMRTRNSEFLNTHKLITKKEADTIELSVSSKLEQLLSSKQAYFSLSQHISKYQNILLDISLEEIFSDVEVV